MPEREYKFVFCSEGCGLGDILQIVAVVAILAAAIALVWAFNIHLNRDIARGRRSVLKQTAQNIRGQRQHVSMQEQRYLDHQDWLAQQAKREALGDSSGRDGHPRRIVDAMRDVGDLSGGRRAAGTRLSAAALEQQRRLRIRQGRKYASAVTSAPGGRRENVGDRAFRKHLEQTLDDQSGQDPEESVKAMTRVDWPNMVGGGGG